MINGLLKTAGRAPAVSAKAQPEVEFEPARALSAPWTLHELRKTLGFSELRRVFRGTRHEIAVEAAVRVGPGRGYVATRACSHEGEQSVTGPLSLNFGLLAVGCRGSAQGRPLPPSAVGALADPKRSPTRAGRVVPLKGRAAAHHHRQHDRRQALPAGSGKTTLIFTAPVLLASGVAHAGVAQDRYCMVTTSSEAAE